MYRPIKTIAGHVTLCILKPERAIEAYQDAMSKKAGDTTLSKKMGQAYVKTHQYSEVHGSCFLLNMDGYSHCYAFLPRSMLVSNMIGC